MRIDHLDFVAKAASTLTESDGIRSGSSIVLEHVSRALGAQIGFTALRGREGDLAEIVSSRGLGAADFRRLEERIVKSSLWRILGMSSPLVIDDLAMEPVLSFMAYGAAVRKLTAVPIVLHNETVGLVAVGFAIGSTVAEEPVITCRSSPPRTKRGSWAKRSPRCSTGLSEPAPRGRAAGPRPAPC